MKAKKTTPKKPPKKFREVIKYARQVYGSDDLEIDDNAKVIPIPEGHWVQGWLYVPQEERTEK